MHNNSYIYLDLTTFTLRAQPVRRSIIYIFILPVTIKTRVGPRDAEPEPEPPGAGTFGLRSRFKLTGCGAGAGAA